MASKLDHALALAAGGFKVFPIKPGAKSPPLLVGWPQKATTDPETIKLYWTPLPDANIGIHCEGLVVIDVDVNKGGNDALELLHLTDELPATLTCVTPTGGRHLYFRSRTAVPNSVGALGSGLDVRSVGGYVVAPASTVPAGEYAWEHPDAAIADAPEWLVDRLTRPVAEAPGRTSTALISDAPDATLEAARTWLQGQDGAQEGQGGDARTYAVACGLRDRGVSAAQAADLLGEWNDKCSPPWTPRELMRKVRNAYAYGQNEPGVRVARPEDFPIVERPIEQAQTRLAPKILSFAAFASQDKRSAGYVVKGLLQRASYAEVFGAPGEGKTFVALDIAYHVAAGKPWHNRKVHQGPVLYLAYEGTGGMVKRAQAIRRRHGADDVPLYIVSAAFNLREKTGRAELGDAVAALPAKPVLIWIDTLARALMGGDENSAQDVGAFNSAVAALIESTGACVAIVHHSGKDRSKGARGSSALLGAIDTEIEIHDHQISSKKQRDIEIAQPIGFKLAPVLVGVDEDGDETTSCVVEPATISEVRALPRISGNYKLAFETLEAAKPTNEPIGLREWRDACTGFLSEDEKKCAKQFHAIHTSLCNKGWVVKTENGMFQRRMT